MNETMNVTITTLDPAAITIVTHENKWGDICIPEDSIKRLTDHAVWEGDANHRFGAHCAIAFGDIFLYVQNRNGRLIPTQFANRRQLRNYVNRYNSLFR